MHHHQWYITTFSASSPLRHHHHNISAPPPLVHHPNTTNHQHNLQYNTTFNIYDHRIWTMSKVRVSSLSLTCELWAKRLAHRILAWPALEVQGATLSATLLKLGFHLEMFHWPNNFWLRLLWVLIFFWTMGQLRLAVTRPQRLSTSLTIMLWRVLATLLYSGFIFAIRTLLGNITTRPSSE